jgi:hypothetical protein
MGVGGHQPRNSLVPAADHNILTLLNPAQIRREIVLNIPDCR